MKLDGPRDGGVWIRLTGLSRRTKQLLMIAVDIIVSIVTMWLAFSLRYGVVFVPFSTNQLIIFGLAPLLAVPIFIRFGLYRAIFRYGGFGAVSAIIRAVSVYMLIFWVSVIAMSLPNVPRTVSIIQPVLFAWAVLAVRSFSGFMLTRADVDKKLVGSEREPLLIFGAGVSGIQTCLALRANSNFEVVGFIDDDLGKIGGQIMNYSVYGRDDIERLIGSKKVRGILLALPNASRVVRNSVIDWLRPYNLHVRSIPSVHEMAAGEVTLTHLKELDIEDLLGRDSVPGGDHQVNEYVEDGVVLVTGAGGSIGSELCRQILRTKPKKLALLDMSEFSLYAIHRELEEINTALGLNIDIVPVLCDVRNTRRLSNIFDAFSPTIVFHAAAYKHVPLVEYNPGEGVMNNVIGTLNVAQAAVASGVLRFVLISTDKAVRPTNIMGASKRMAEVVLQAMAAEREIQFDGKTVPNNTIFTMVRFGNVLGSSGSVVPLFRKQLADGGPLTVTHPDVTRYFMTIREAAQLVLQAGALAEGGEVFLLHMGQPVKIIDLAKRMIELTGYTLRDQDNPAGDIEIAISGMRPGEKLYEELLIDDSAMATANERIMKARERMWPWHEVNDSLDRIRAAASADNVAEMRLVLSLHVEDFAESGKIVDVLHR